MRARLIRCSQSYPFNSVGTAFARRVAGAEAWEAPSNSERLRCSKVDR